MISVQLRGDWGVGGGGGEILFFRACTYFDQRLPKALVHIKIRFPIDCALASRNNNSTWTCAESSRATYNS